MARKKIKTKSKIKFKNYHLHSFQIDFALLYFSNLVYYYHIPVGDVYNSSLVAIVPMWSNRPIK